MGEILEDKEDRMWRDQRKWREKHPFDFSSEGRHVKKGVGALSDSKNPAEFAAALEGLSEEDFRTSHALFNVRNGVRHRLANEFLSRMSQTVFGNGDDVNQAIQEGLDLGLFRMAGELENGAPVLLPVPESSFDQRIVSDLIIRLRAAWSKFKFNFSQRLEFAKSLIGEMSQVRKDPVSSPSTRIFIDTTYKSGPNREPCKVIFDEPTLAVDEAGRDILIVSVSVLDRLPHGDWILRQPLNNKGNPCDHYPLGGRNGDCLIGAPAWIIKLYRSATEYDSTPVSPDN